MTTTAEPDRTTWSTAQLADELIEVLKLEHGCRGTLMGALSDARMASYAERDQLSQRAQRAEAQVERMYELQAQHTESEGIISAERDRALVRLAEAVQAERARCIATVPTTWLDSLLSGPAAILDAPPWNCPDIEALCKAIRERMENPK